MHQYRMEKADFRWFEEQIKLLTGVDLFLYKENQMKRRIDALIARYGFEGYEVYAEMLKQDHAMLEYFLNYITINVTEFFRTPEHWARLDDEVLKKLHNPKIWSVACCTGQEAYSLVMGLSVYMPLSEIHVLATDMNNAVLETARRGIYSETELGTVPEEFRKRYFEPVPEGFRVRDEVRRCVEFRKMDILQESPSENFDMIVCRNVLIYFTREAQDLLYREFHDRLLPGGVLFTGNTEQILNASDFGYRKICNYIYAKTT